MRVPKLWVAHIASRVAGKLLGEKLVETDATDEEFTAALGELILEELTVEDRINDEVRLILKQYEDDIDRGRLDYHKLFDLTKRKIVRDRNAII